MSGGATPDRRSRGAGGPPAVSLEGITKSFPERRSWTEMLRDPLGGGEEEVLRGIDLEVPRGEFFGLLGPNGAGKSTLFRILATLVLPDSGRARVLGRDVVRESSAARELVGPVIGNERSLYWRLSATENLELFAALHGVDRGTRRRRARELLDLVGLADAGTKIVAEFSSGMRQRLLLARALVSGPEVLLLDEPTRSLDPLAARDFRAFLRREMAERLGCTVLLATHDTAEAAELCDRVGMLHEGRLLAVGTVDELGRILAGDRYRVWARSLDVGTLRWLEDEGAVRGYTVEQDQEGGWTEATLEVPGGFEQASQVLSSLTLRGAEVARFERDALSLTDVMERLLEANERTEDDGDPVGRPGRGRPPGPGGDAARRVEP